MARAAIKLYVDISPVMAQLHKQIEGCAYNSDSPALAFRIRGMSVVIHPQEINVFRAEDESSAPQVIAWLKELITNPERRLTHEGKVLN